VRRPCTITRHCVQFSLGEGMDIGEDVGSAVDFTYKLPFTFTGRID
jgi:arylsulfatase